MSIFKKSISLLIFLLAGIYAKGQMFEPVHWQTSVTVNNEIMIKATIDGGWHLYDINLPPDAGPIPTSFEFKNVKGIELVGKVTSPSKVISKYDAQFQANLRWFEGSAIFIQKFKLINPAQFNVEGTVNYMSCNDQSCVPGSSDFHLKAGDLPKGMKVEKAEAPTETSATSTTQAVVVDSATQKTISDSAQVVTTPVSDSTLNLWAPVIDKLKNFGTEGSGSHTSWWYIFIGGFVGGLLALVTPCVWPMIPMTVSFFLKRSKKNRKKAIADSFIYALSIIVIYLILGLLITAIFGASSLNDLATNAVFNLIFFAILVLFAISFFGAFELTLPSSWTTKLDTKADSTTGILSIFFMAFTLVLVSFSCTGPIIGNLLVDAASQGNVTGPAIGMFGFALALSIPFALFAIFPSWLESMPKSGGWLNSVKVVLAFLELALALKFLSVADLAYKWKILDREVFLVLWIIIFVLLGMYLLGKIKFSHDSDLKHVSIPRLFMSIISFAFALYMVPGLWGAPLKAISAFSPPLYTQDFNLYHGEVKPKFYDYDEGMAIAAKNKKPVMIDFTGYGCVNCRNMEAAVWTDPRVKNIIDNEYVLISLYVDDKDRLPQPITVQEYGKTRTLKTVGDKWSYLQRSKFGANAQPFYVLLDNAGNPIAPAYAYDKDIDKYLKFLNKGLEVYRNK